MSRPAAAVFFLGPSKRLLLDGDANVTMRTFPPEVSPLASPEFDVTVRVGCSLAYEVTGTAWLLVHLKPRPDRNHAVVFEALTLGYDLPADEFTDVHGNLVYRVALARGSNFIRHDAIVSVSSQPDNLDLPSCAPLSPGELPPAILRYTLPSRYCDSDKLADFAWEKFGQVEHGLPRVTAISQWVHDNIEYRYFPPADPISPLLHVSCNVGTEFAATLRILPWRSIGPSIFRRAT